MWGLIALFFLLCMMFFLWLAENAPLVDEHEQPIDEPEYKPSGYEAYRRFEQ